MSDKFPEVPSGYPFPALEKDTLERWAELEVFEKTLERTADGEPFVFYEGPPTANNKPHIGHVVTRVVKDLFPRFQTMRGRHVLRKAGWDTHGLPVEIEVEKTLGFSGKQDIEAYGVEKFNAACLESVHTYERQWRAMTERIGFWIDLDDPYLTYSNTYVESVWWSLKTLADKGLLVEDYKIQPYCTRCGTTLSSHEVAQNYQDADDPSVWVRFPARGGQSLETVDGGRFEAAAWADGTGLALVAWTTTPWTLLGHSGLAVNPELDYRIVEDPVTPGRHLLFGDGLETAMPMEIDDPENPGKRKRLDLRDLEPVARIRGSALHGLRYDRPFPTVGIDRDPGEPQFDPAPSEEEGWRVFAAEYVTATEGSGLVHTAPAFGEDDFQSGKKWSLPFFLTVDRDGRIVDRGGIERFAGLGFKEADPEITRDLKERGLLVHGERYRHNYPFCWRCDQPLLYYANKSWFVRTTAARDRLVELNRTIGWRPEHIRDGRFGNWLENVVDWALSRKRYWGTPLPVWRCDSCEEIEVVGSYAELFDRAGLEPPTDFYDRQEFDPHRPFVDPVAEDGSTGRFTWACSADGCEGRMGRVDDVIDAWYDSGSMSFAQHHYPFENEDLFGKTFPANFISEAVDQTRGWFYTLHALGTLLFDSVAYENCIVLGHINDEKGVKMSKRLGNVVDPMQVIEETGADALRWYFCINNPELSGRFSARLVREAAQKFLLPLWNALSFFSIYANLDGWRPSENAAEIPFADRPALDRWILLRLDSVTREVTDSLESYDIVTGARSIERFLDDLTNWYIRRSRERFWAGMDAGAADETGKESAYRTLYEVLETLSRLIAPFTPFVAEEVHARLVRCEASGRTDAPESVHLEPWPEPGDRADDALEAGMEAVQRIVRLGHAARNTHGLKTRQPLSGVTIVTSDGDLPGRVEPHLDLLRDELNVHTVRWAEQRSDYVHHEVVPIFPKCGPRFGKRMPLVKKSLAEADGDALAESLEADGKISIDLEGEPTELSAEEVEVRLVEREGTATQGDRELLVALDAELTEALIAEGWAREVVHRIQAARKDRDLDYADRIRVRYAASPELEAAIDTHREWISGETLAVEFASTDESAGLAPAPVDDHEFAFDFDVA